MSTHEQTTTDSTIENPVAEAPGIHDALAEGQSSAIDNITSQTPWWVVSTTLHALLIHSNMRVRIGPLKWLIGTPEFHHWHHSNQPEAYNKNFAGGMPLIDLVFGTAHAPGTMPERYGLDEPAPKTWWSQMRWPFRARARTLSKMS